MILQFYKYQGAGNDFIMVDNRALSFPTQHQQVFIEQLCDRHFGIGANGLILMESHTTADFEMRYFNSDGRPSSMCGNGGRCAVAFANDLGWIGPKTTFIVNGATYDANRHTDGMISLKMQAVDAVTIAASHCFLDTGSPHHVVFTDCVHDIDVATEGRAIRYSEPYGAAGTNVNFVAPIAGNRFSIRTYERGVEDETLACGTGAVAAAVAAFATKAVQEPSVSLEAVGGRLRVDFKPVENGYTDIFLTGPARFVFKGEWTHDD